MVMLSGLQTLLTLVMLVHRVRAIQTHNVSSSIHIMHVPLMSVLMVQDKGSVVRITMSVWKKRTPVKGFPSFAQRTKDTVKTLSDANNNWAFVGKKISFH